MSIFACVQGYAPALSPLTGDSGTGTSSTTGGSAAGLRGTINNAVEATKEYLPTQVPNLPCTLLTV